MKVIDLLNKIANGELKDLTLVKFCKNDCLARYHKTDERFEFINKGDWDNYFNLIDIAELNDEVEIIEEDKKIEFENIEEFKEHKLINTKDILELEMIINKINAEYNYKINVLIQNQKKLIDVINNLKGSND